jgi:2-polyprenyl-3-methyl-5-hydroxy-6-metoxy-1,4-benzoquinol methylase
MNPQISSKDLMSFYPTNYSPHQYRPSKETKKHRNKKISLPSSVYRKLNEHSRVLDVGCGSGSFLNKIKILTNCQVCGVDISQTARNSAKNNYGLDIFCGTITEAPFAGNSFDLITAWSYLEHVPNPSQVLQKLHDLLKPDGDCIISCPNFDSLNAAIFGNKWYHLDCPRHLYIYTPQTITELLKKSGFVVKKMIHEKLSKGLLGSLQYYFYGDNFNPKYRNKIRRSSLIKTIASPLTRLAAIIKKADAIIVHAASN